MKISPLKPAAEDAVEGIVRTGDAANYWWVSPNFMVNLYTGVMDTNLVLPLGPDRCRVIFDFYFADGTPTDFIAQSIAVAEQVQQEDVGICEDVQARPAQPIVLDRPIQRPPGEWRLSLSSIVGAGMRNGMPADGTGRV